MSDSIKTDKTKIRQWIKENIDAEKIQREMILQGFDKEVIDAHLEERKRIIHSKRQSTGFILLAVGAAAGFISCVLTLTNPFPDLFHWILYGLTSAAVIVICIGLYFVFE